MRNVYIRLGAFAYSLFIWALLAQFAMAQGGNPGVTAVSPRTAWDIVQWQSNTQIVGQGRTLTASQPARIAQTWNNAGVTFTGARVAITDTASNAASLLLDLQVGGASITTISKAGIIRTAAGLVNAPTYSFTAYTGSGFWASTSSNIRVSLATTETHRFNSTTFSILDNAAALLLGASNDVVLIRDAAGTLAQRNGVNAQEHRLYFTYTNASNYARLSFLFGSGAGGNAAIIRTEQAGTGGARNLAFGTSGTVRWGINTSGHFLAEADNTYDIGANGATRPRTGYFGTSVNVGGGGDRLQTGALILATTSEVQWNTRSRMTSPADGQILIRNAAATANSDLTLLGVQTTGAAFGSLPTCNAGLIGMRRHITDGAAAPAFMAAAAGGGAVVTPVFCDGAAWVNG